MVSHTRPRLPGSGESSGSGLTPHHWHFSHPVFVMTGLRITEVPFVKYRTIGLFCCQRTYGKSAEVGFPKNRLLYTSHREGPKDNPLQQLSIKIERIIQKSASEESALKKSSHLAGIGKGGLTTSFLRINKKFTGGLLYILEQLCISATASEAAVAEV